ncbi:MAG: DUF4445 domain-containing protein [Oscillospiraceae bacterium]|nr:DUF4445 domain-containing protein [Oscillospiraceae bacterium]
MSTIVVTTEERKIEAEKGDDLLSILRSAGIHIAADCGGHGTCGKCAVDIVTGDDTERILACGYRVLTDISVRLPDKDAGGIKTANRTGDLDLSYDAAACDLGTTTVSIAVVRNGRLFEKTEINRLTGYGSDVISRASYIKEHDALGKLSGELKRQIYEMTETLCAENHVPIPEEMCIGGNTVMQHILAGKDPFPITVYPFAPETLFLGDDSILDICGIKAHLMPCVAGYFGGDLTAGLFYLEDRLKGVGNALFIDIGTNGEMALISGDAVTCCSVASGPAFEGGNIECGMPGTNGAVEHATIKNGKLVCKVIGNVPAKGICGSGLIDIVSALLDEGIIDMSGRFLPPEESEVELDGYTEDDDENGSLALADGVYLSAKDVRMLQMAKAAVAAGIETLMSETSISAEDIDAVFLAGGFGTLLDIGSAVNIGMIPAALKDRCIPVGNTSLKGTMKAMSRGMPEKELISVKEKCRYVELSQLGSFNERYIDNMMFGG